MSIQRVAVIYNDKPRPETTGFYCRKALGRLVEVAHILPADLDHVPRGGFDLYVNIDDGLPYRLPSDLRPCAWWAIDTHLDFEPCLEKARDFDFVFAAQRDGADRLKREGIATATWLPLACDPDIHKKHEVEKTFDVCFVGNVLGGPRAELLELLKKHFPNSFVGQCYFEEMARTYSAGRLAFNRSIGNDINMRVFEALACGALVLTNDLGDNGLNELFQNGVHLATYTDAEEFLYKANYYLANEAARERIALAGRAEVLAHHTYEQRMVRLLEVCGARIAKGERAMAVHQVVDSTPDRQDERRPEAAPVRPVSPIPNSTSDRGSHEPPILKPNFDPLYFQCSRPELLDMIPLSAKKVLDIGCGAGRLGQSLKTRQETEVSGVEVNAEAAHIARHHLDHVYTGDVEEWQPSAGSNFDAIVCGDILEHLHEPAALLRRARTWLGPEGVLIASIPNVRHHTVLCGLLEGNWTYEPAGLLDRDHLRFFTRREIEKLFDRAGFSITELRMVPGPGYQEWRDRQRPGEVKAGRLHIGGLAPEEAEEFYVYQYLVSARPATMPDYGLTSIVILTHNQLPFTRECLDSIAQYTDEPHEIIVVDNGSSDGTVDYLRARPGITLIENENNRGFPVGANQGIRAAKGSQVLLLNNDTVATTGWLKRLLRALHSDPKIGLAGPCSNCVSGPQQVDNVRYEDLSGLDGFAWDWGRSNAGTLIDTDRLVGFCLLIRREVIDQIGFLDERFGMGCFDDDDYCLRTLRAGFRAVIARDAFVHHVGGQTFRGSGIDFGALMRKNEELFRRKWHSGNTNDHALVHPPSGNGTQQKPFKNPVKDRTRVNLFDIRVAAGGGLLLTPKAIQLSLCMIVRDNAQTIRQCLESIRPWVDEMVVVDTGSVDETPRIAEELGARVFHFPWCDSFSKARNESLRHARGKWIFWMDSDDTIDPANGRQLRELARRACEEQQEPGVLGYVVQVHCPGRPDEPDNITAVDHVKLFRNLAELRFEGRIHEQIIPAIRRLGGEIGWTDFFVLHSGYDHSPEGQERKNKRDLRLLHSELQEQPEHPFTLFNLGMTYADIGRHEEAIAFLRRSIARSKPEESHLRKAYALLVHSQQRLGQLHNAWKSCEDGLMLYGSDPELLFRKAGLLHECRMFPDAVKAYQHLLRTKADRHFSSVVKGIQGHLARHNLAVLYEDMGELSKAEEQWRLVCKEMPRYAPGRRGLQQNLLRQGRHEEATAECAGLMSEAHSPAPSNCP